VTWALIDRNARKGPKPSDHAPLFVDVDVEAAGDAGGDVAPRADAR
jgi:exodeoxyribonuclease-3